MIQYWSLEIILETQKELEINVRIPEEDKSRARIYDPILFTSLDSSGVSYCRSFLYESAVQMRDSNLVMFR